MLGLELFNEGRPEEAIRELNAFLETAKSGHHLVPHWLEPTRAEILTSRETVARAYGLLADRAFDAGRLEPAADDYGRYLAAHPDDMNALMRLGVTLAALNRSHDAVDVFQRAVKVAPASAVAHRNLAMALFEARNAEAAEPHAREAIRLNPTDAGAHDLLGRVLAVRGNLAEAADEFRRALEINPNEADARADLARLAALTARARVQSP
jgi:tetratricopeptide (TPR) repeat protein